MESTLSKKRTPVTKEECEEAIKRLSKGGLLVSLGHFEQCILSLHPSVREFESCTPYLLNRAFVEADSVGKGHLTAQQLHTAATSGSHVLIWRHMVRLGLTSRQLPPPLLPPAGSPRLRKRAPRRYCEDTRSPGLCLPQSDVKPICDVSDLAHDFPSMNLNITKSDCDDKVTNRQLLPALTKKTVLKSFKPKVPHQWAVAAPRSHLKKDRDRNCKKKSVSIIAEVSPKRQPFSNRKCDEDILTTRTRAARSRMGSVYRFQSNPHFRPPLKPQSQSQFLSQFNPGKHTKFDTTKATSSHNKNENISILSSTRKEMQPLYSSLEHSSVVANPL